MSDVPRSWSPSEAVIESARVSGLMRFSGFDSFAQLLGASTRNPTWFWDAAVGHLELPFETPYSEVLSEERGPAWAKWFVGGRLNLASTCLDRWSDATPDRVAVTTESESGIVEHVTYLELRHRVEGLADLLRKLNIGPGDRVAVYMPMIVEAVVALLTAAKLGVVAVPLFSGYGTDAVRMRLEDAGVAAVLTADGTTRRGKPIAMGQVAVDAASEVRTVKAVVLARVLDVSVTPRIGGPELHPWPDPRTDAQTTTEALSSDHPLLLAYTSGTTGKPKGAVHVHGGMPVKVAAEAAYQLDIGQQDTLAWISDMGWIMGPYQVIAALAFGSRLYLVEGVPDYPGPGRLWAGVEREQLTVLGMSPTLVRSLIGHGDAVVTAHDLSSLRVLASTGEMWDTESWLWYFNRIGNSRCPVINMSGGTEVGGSLLAAHPVQRIEPGALVGPSLGMAVDVFDNVGHPLRGAVGELVCTHSWPGMTTGFLNDPQRYLETYWSRWPDVWAHGDWASIDSRGDWYLHGRSDDTIMIAGKRLGPAEPESILVSHPKVLEAAAVGVPDPIKGEALAVFVVVAPSAEGTEGLEPELADRLSVALGKSFKPASVTFVTQLPKTRSGKVMRRVLRSVAIGGDPGDLSSMEDAQVVEDLVAAVDGRQSVRDE